MAEELRDALARLGEVVEPAEPAEALAGAWGHRARRQRRRRLVTTGVGLATVAVLVGAALAVTRASDDGGRNVSAAQQPGVVALPRLPNEVVALAGDDDGLWVLTTPASRAGPAREGTVLRLDLDGTVAATGSVPGPVSMIAVSDDSVWLTDEASDAVTRLDRGSLAVTATISLDTCPECEGGRTAVHPEDLAVLDGAPWVSSREGELVRIDPGGDRLGFRVERDRSRWSELAADGEGLWLTEGRRVVHLDSRGHEIEPTVDLDDVSFANAVGFRVTDVTVTGDQLWLSVHSDTSIPADQTAIADASTGEVLTAFGPTSLGLGDDAWFVAGGMLLRGVDPSVGPGIVLDPTDLAEDTYLEIPPDRPAAVAGGDYWFASGAREITRVPADHGDPSTTEVVQDPVAEVGPADAGGCVAPPPGFDGGEASTDRLSPEELEDSFEGLDPQQQELADQILANARADRTPVAVPPGVPDGWVSNTTLNLPGGELGPVVDADGCLIGWFGGGSGFVTREEAEDPSADPEDEVPATDGVVPGGTFEPVVVHLDGELVRLLSAEEQVVVPTEPFVAVSGIDTFRLRPSGIEIVHNTEFVNCLTEPVDLCDPDIDDRELHVQAVDGDDGQLVAALLPEGVATMVVEVGNIRVWQQARAREFAVVLVGTPFDPSAEIRVLGFDAGGAEVFDHPLE